MKGKLEKNVLLKDFSSWRTGGFAKQLYKPFDLDDLSAFLTSLPEDEEIVWLGLGSNTLIRDGGFDGTVIVTLGTLNHIEKKDKGIIRLEAGVPCAKAARYFAREGFADAEFWAGIPGTIGGALAMNAGCHGGETWTFVKAVETINRKGDIRIEKPDVFSPEYRHVNLPQDTWFVAGYFEFPTGESQVALDKIKTLLSQRAQSQPTSQASCGSVFRNPKGDYAARLIQSCGLKGYRTGDVSVSDKHANFIINHGGALSADIESLIAHVQNVVKEKTGIALVTEVRIIGTEA